MEYEQFEPPAEEPQEYKGPTKADFLMQIESDYYTESQRETPNQEVLDALAAKKEAVKATDSDEDAHAAYHAAVESTS